MKKVFGYFSAAFLAAFLAVTLQTSLASAQQSNSGHPSPECEACAQACRDEFDLCKLTNGTSKSAFGKCAEALEKCGAECRKPGGACNPHPDTGGR